MSWKIKDKKTGEVFTDEFNTKGEAWEALQSIGIDWADAEQTGKFHVYDEGKAQALKDKGKELGEKAQQLAESPMLQEEDMTTGETLASFALPVTAEFAKRGKDPSLSATGETAFTALGGPAYLGMKSLAGKALPKAIAKVAPALLTGSGYGLASEAGIAEAQDRDMTAGDVAFGVGMGLAPDAAVTALKKTPVAMKGLAKGLAPLTGVSDEALEAFGGGFGKRAKGIMKAEADGQQIAADLLDLAKNPPFEEEEAVKRALAGAEASTEGVKDVLLEGVGRLGEQPQEKDAAKTLIGLIDALDREGATVSANRLRKIRGFYDDLADYSGNSSIAKTNELVNKVLKDARTAAKEELINVAGTGPQQQKNKAIREANKRAQQQYEKEVAEAEARKVATAAEEKASENQVLMSALRGSPDAGADAKSRNLASMFRSEPPVATVPEKVSIPMPEKPVPIPEVTPKGSEEYKQAMRTYSDKMDALENLNKMLGKTPLAREMRIDSFMNTYLNSNKTAQRKMIGLVDDVFGKDFANRLEDYAFSKKLGMEGGKVPFLTQKNVGEGKMLQLLSGLAFPPSLLATSPKLSSGVMGLSDLATKAIESEAANRYVDPYLRTMARPAATNMSELAGTPQALTAEGVDAPEGLGILTPQYMSELAR